MNANPVATTLAIIVMVSMVGLIITYWRRSRLFQGYDEHSSDAQELANRLNADVFRDGIDLVMSGNYGRLPTVIRFSYADNTPGLNVKMRAPATFNMSIAPKGAKAPEGKVQMRTPDETFDTRFVTRTNDPMQARIFVANKAAFAQIQKLCCSAQTFLTLSTGVVELSELTIPSPYGAKHIQNHLDSMASLAVSLQQMPGADAIKIKPSKKEYSKTIRAALVVGVITAIVAVVSAMRDRSSTAAATGSAPDEYVVKDVPAGDVQRLGGLVGYRLAGESDFDRDAVAWARAQTQSEISGRIPAAFTGDAAQDVAYVLIAESGAGAGNKRVAIVAGNEVKYDAVYPELAIVGMVPHANLAGTSWVGAAPPPADGDGLLLVRKRDDPRSGAVIFLSDGRAQTAIPTSYANVGIR